MCSYVAHIFNQTFLTGLIPAPWKSASVVPLHKSGDNLNNYHPISKLPFLEKILESLVNLQLCAFINSLNILQPQQSGHSTITAAVSVVDNIVSSLDKNNLCCPFHGPLKGI